jgi:hypothetical protein
LRSVPACRGALVFPASRREPTRALGDPLRRRSASFDKRRRQCWKIQLAEGRSLRSIDESIPHLHIAYRREPNATIAGPQRIAAPAAGIPHAVRIQLLQPGALPRLADLHRADVRSLYVLAAIFVATIRTQPMMRWILDASLARGMTLGDSLGPCAVRGPLGRRIQGKSTQRP